METLKILMLNYEFPPVGGGAANACYYMLKEFSKIKGIEIDLVTSSPDNSFSVERFSGNIRVFRLNIRRKQFRHWSFTDMARWSISLLSFCRKTAKKNHYDLCHCWFGWPNGFIGWLLRKKIPYIISLRGSDVPGHNKKLKLLDRLFLSPVSKIAWKYAESVIANSEGLKMLASKTSKKDIRIIYNGVDTKEFTPGRKISGRKPLKIISTGRLSAIKGYGYLIKAMENLPDTRLCLVGDGPEKQELEVLAGKLKVDTSFTGRVNHSEIKKYLNAADIFVLPSLNEGMSNSLLEAMACGLPVIATNVGGTKELLKSNGFNVNRRSSKGIRSALMAYIKYPKLIKEHGKASRAIAESMAWEKAAKTYLEEYKKAIRNRQAMKQGI